MNMNLKKKRSNRFNLIDMSTKKSGLMQSRSAVRTCGLLVMSLLAGCTIGPAVYESSFTQYNDAVRKTLDEQMLANLVRMRYYDSPMFLQVASLNTTFSVGASAGASATAVSGGNDTLGANVGGSYSESPTISFSMPESEKYYGKLLAPLSAAQVTSLVLAGFDSELVFRTAVRGMNGLQNLNAEYDASFEEPVAHANFREALILIKKLRSQRMVDLELGGKETFWSSPVKLKASSDLAQVLLLGAASYAMSNDAEIVGYPDGTWQTHRYEKHMALRFAPASKDLPDAQRLKKLLALKSDHNNFSIVEAELVNAEKARGVLGQSPGALDPSVIWVEIGLRGRSMLEIMQVASKEVQVPEEDIKMNVASADQSEHLKSSTGATDWLNIKTSESAPSNSSLSVQYRGNYFYIDDSDLSSRRTFAMLTALFAVVGGTVPGAHPVLTLPVGR
jgi:hypothetical protein